VVAGLALGAAPVAVLAAADNAHAQATQTMPEKSLYERLGGVFAIAAVVNQFSDAVVKNPIVGVSHGKITRGLCCRLRRKHSVVRWVSFGLV
jgi:hypothetical protein